MNRKKVGSDEGGYVIICAVNYFEEMGGGGKDSFIEYTKNFVDDINAFHSRTEELQVGYNTMNMAGVHFYDSIVVVEKR